MADNGVLARVNEYIERSSADIVYGNVFQVQKNKKELRRYGNLCKSNFYFYMGSCICHQAMFVKRELFKRKIFDINYLVCADREWLMFQKKNGVVMEAMQFPVSIVLIEGFSSGHVKELEKETAKCLRSYYGKGVWIYKALLMMKKNMLVGNALKGLEKIFFVRRSR